MKRRDLLALEEDNAAFRAKNVRLTSALIRISALPLNTGFDGPKLIAAVEIAKAELGSVKT